MNAATASAIEVCVIAVCVTAVVLACIRSGGDVKRRTVITRSRSEQTVKTINGKVITTEETGDDVKSIPSILEWTDWWKKFDEIFQRKS